MAETGVYGERCHDRIEKRMVSRNNKAEELLNIRMGMVHRYDIEKRNDGHGGGGLIN